MKTRILFTVAATLIAGRVTTSAQGPSVIEFASSLFNVREDESEIAVTVTRSSNLDASVTVDYATSDFASDTAATAGADYVATSGTLRFGPDQASQSFAVPILNDGQIERERVAGSLHREYFRVTLSNPSERARLGANWSAFVGIQDNDRGLRFEADSLVVSEDAGSITLTVVRGNHENLETITVDYATMDDEAKAGSDYVAGLGTLTFPAGQANQAISIPILNDGLRETNETFSVTLTDPSAGAYLEPPTTLTVTIVDNDPGVHFASSGSGSSEDGGEVVLRVDRGNDVNLEAFTVDYTTNDDTAQAGLDYAAASGTLSFAQGERSRTVAITILNDAEHERWEDFRVRLSNPTGSLPLGSPGEATVSIGDNDPGPAFAKPEYRVDEGAGAVELTVLRGNDIEFPPLSVEVLVRPQGARAGEDFTIPAGQLEFAAGATTATLRIPILEDSLDEGDETFLVSLPTSTGELKETTVRILDNDGPLHWALRHQNPIGGFVQGVGFGAGKFVAVGHDRNLQSVVAASSDGLNWTMQPVPEGVAYLRDVAYGNGRFVAVGGDGVILSSTEREQWTSQGSGAATGVALEGIVFGNDRFVTWGEEWQQDVFRPYILSSADGSEWARTELPSAVEDIAFGNGLFVFVGAKGAILTSPDGQTWTRQTSPTQLDLQAVGFGDGMFLTISGYDWEKQETHLLSSPDGIQWAVQTLPQADWLGASTLVYHEGAFIGGNLRIKREGDQWRVQRTAGPYLTDVAIGNGLLVGTGGGLLVSSDGHNWAALNVTLHELAYGAGMFVAAGGITSEWRFGGLLSSRNGLDWTPRETPTATEIFSVAYGNGRFVGITPSEILTSADGQRWTAQKSPVHWQSTVAFGDGRFVAIGEEPDSGQWISAASTDGINWTTGNLPADFLVDWVNVGCLTYGNDQFLFIAGGEVLTSKDGIEWMRSTPVDTDRVVFANGVFVAWSPWDVEGLWTSPNGLQWTRQPQNLGVGFADIAYGGGLFVAIATSWEFPASAFVSRDLRNWRRYSPPVDSWLGGVAYANGRFYLLGDNSTILQSNPIIHLHTIDLTDAGVRLNFTGETDHQYEVQTSADLIRWDRLGTVPGTQEQMEYLDRTPPGTAARFYRVVMQENP